MKRFLSIVCLFVLFSCDTYMKNDIVTDSKKPVEIVPIETALQNLENFLADTDMSKTKSGMERGILSIETHYNKTVQTKVGETTVEPYPDAYIVNFENNEGFAVLGANTNVTPIIAVTRNGNLEEGFLDMNFSKDNLTVDEEGNIIDLSEIDYYCAEEDDYYVMAVDSNAEKKYIQELLQTGITYIEYQDGQGETGVSGTPKYVTVAPMLETTWDQGDWNILSEYNKYCYKKKLDGTKKYVLAGCSTIAMAQIVAYNEFPTSLVVQGETIDYKNVKTSMTADSLDTKGANDVGLIIGSIFHSVYKLFTLEAGTCITPRQIKKRMVDYGYSNVKQYSACSFNDSFKSATNEMLIARKPVFVSAMRGLAHGHSWVIDGAHYDDGNWMVNCNWGWEGSNDGYYSTNCFNPNGEKYTWHFRLITYSVPDNGRYSIKF